MEDLGSSSGYVPIGSLSAAIDGAPRASATPSKRPQYFAALAGTVGQCCGAGAARLQQVYQTTYSVNLT